MPNIINNTDKFSVLSSFTRKANLKQLKNVIHLLKYVAGK